MSFVAAALSLALPWYEGVDRHYHNGRHIREMFDFATAAGVELLPAETVAVAFHDAIYIPMEKDCEQASAQLALQHRTPIQTMKDRQKQRPDLFKKRVSNRPGLDIYIRKFQS